MKIYFAVVFFLGISFSSYSQYYEMLNSYRIDIHRNFTSNGYVQIDSSKNEIKYAYVFENDTKIYLTCSFTSEKLGGDLCNKMLYEFLCDECFKDNISSVTNKKGEWFESEPNYYISKKRLAFELGNKKDNTSEVKIMRIEKTPNAKTRATIFFEIETMRTEIWKKLKK